MSRSLPMRLQFFAEPDPKPATEKEPEVQAEQPKPIIETPKEVKPIIEDPKPSEVTPEVKSEPVKPIEDNSKELAELRQKLAEAEGFKTQYENAKEDLGKYEASLAQIAEQKVNSLPEEYRGLVPEGSTQDKLDWLAKAEKSGLLAKKEEKSIGQSTKVNHHESNKVEMKDMTANQKLISGIKEYYARGK